MHKININCTSNQFKLDVLGIKLRFIECAIDFTTLTSLSILSCDRSAARLATMSSISFKIAPSAATSDELLSSSNGFFCCSCKKTRTKWRIPLKLRGKDGQKREEIQRKSMRKWKMKRKECEKWHISFISTYFRTIDVRPAALLTEHDDFPKPIPFDEYSILHRVSYNNKIKWLIPNIGSEFKWTLYFKRVMLWWMSINSFNNWSSFLSNL